MQFIAHRGLWQAEEQQNTLKAFENAFAEGFGIETDVRDYCGKLVVSHDVPSPSSLSLDSLLELYKSFLGKPLLALNIKSDGLVNLLYEKVAQFNIENYFFFDMSVPDTLPYLKKQLRVFTRQSEYEKDPCFYAEAQGIWLDQFVSSWFDESTLKDHLMNKKKVCIVSPELHRRDFKQEWRRYKSFMQADHLSSGQLLLCTDHPQLGRKFFYEQN
jgi:glycerophosphoryl diester phosphodiesterase